MLFSDTPRAVRAWNFVGLILLTVNLRAAITGVSPVLDDVQAAFGLSGVEVGVLTTLPVLCLGVFASLAPPLARRIGTEAAVAVSLGLTTAGILLRVVPSTTALFAGTTLAGAGIALGNVLVPAVVKRDFAERVGTLTGLAMMLMAVSGAVAAGTAVPLDDAAGWRVALAVWAVPSLIGMAVWGPPALRGRRARVPAMQPAFTGGSLLRSPPAWAVAVFLGVVSLMFYVLVAWLPGIMRDRGYSAAEAGGMVSVMLTIGIPLGFLVPVAAARLRHQGPLVIGVCAAKVVGLGGILLAPDAGWVWISVLGLATGSAFPLAITLLSLRSPNPSVAARLSGMAQTGGYLVAGAGPLAVGVLHGATGGWGVPLLLLLALVVPETVAGLLAARPRHVTRGDLASAAPRAPRPAVLSDSSGG
ncbi:MFS transporter [Streptomyces sp. NPDC005728]|uniref:CynX/NimT family MFS transporter n=1 Tax=Streptomyces sp. NPDC005728 TaxID=3157054 RepID=UPI0033D7DD50